MMGVGGAATWLTACSSSPAGLERSATAMVFSEPNVLTSSNGRLELTLRAEPADLPWGGSTRYAYTYNGSSPGPTLRIRPGDQLVIHLENSLEADTNLHTHGLQVSPSGNSDNIFIRVPPGASRTYIYDVPPDHRSGLFWYHPHAHGTVAEQVAAGLAGAIVVTDKIDDLPEIATSTERIWILSDPPIGSSPSDLDTGAMDRMIGREGDTILVNGIERPHVGTKGGTLERWRIVNASSSRYYRLALDGHPLHTIASDGGRLAMPATVDEILLSPGERTELLVTPTTPGTYAFRALRYDRASGAMMGGMMGGVDFDEAIVATMTVTGDGRPAALPTSMLDPNELSLPAPSAVRTIEFGMGMGGAMMGGGRGDMMSFTIDGKTFDADRTDITIAPGTVEEWEIRNTSPMDHPLHLHVWPFLVVDGPTGSSWKDTINVPANQSVRVVIAFTGITGRTVYHCHILDHEDLGMMGTIDVPGDPPA